MPGESCGQRSLAGYSLWGHKESETMEATKRAHSVCQGEKDPVLTCTWVCACVCVCTSRESRGPGPQREITPRTKLKGRFLSQRGEWALEPGEKRGEPEPQRGKWGLPHKGDAVHAGAPQFLDRRGDGLELEWGRPAGREIHFVEHLRGGMCQGVNAGLGGGGEKP